MQDHPTDVGEVTHCVWAGPQIRTRFLSCSTAPSLGRELNSPTPPTLTKTQSRWSPASTLKTKLPPSGGTWRHSSEWRSLWGDCLGGWRTSVPLGAPGILVLSTEVVCNQGLFYLSQAKQINSNDDRQLGRTEYTPFCIKCCTYVISFKPPQGSSRGFLLLHPF